MNEQIENIIKNILKGRDSELIALKPSPKKFLKVPSYVSKNPEYETLHEIKTLDKAFFAIVKGSRENTYSAVFAVISGLIFELDEYSFEALGMNEELLNYYYEVTGKSPINYTFEF